DIVLLAEKFVADFTRPRGGGVVLSPAAKRALAAHPWPGNVRELKNTIERAVHFARGGVIEPTDLFLGRPGRPLPAPPVASEPPAELGDDALYAQPFKEAKQAMVDAFERRYFARLLEQ